MPDRLIEYKMKSGKSEPFDTWCLHCGNPTEVRKSAIRLRKSMREDEELKTAQVYIDGVLVKGKV